MLMVISKDLDMKEKVQAGVKIHSIRKGKRWKPGQKIHFWDGAPYAKSNDPKAFYIHPHGYIGDHIPLWYQNVTTTHQVGITTRFFRLIPGVAAVEDLEIIMHGTDYKHPYKMTVGGAYLTWQEMETLSRNEGFEGLHDFLKFMWEYADQDEDINSFRIFSGQIVHWTLNKLYNEEEAQISQAAKEAQEKVKI